MERSRPARTKTAQHQTTLLDLEQLEAERNTILEEVLRGRERLNLIECNTKYQRKLDRMKIEKLRTQSQMVEDYIRGNLTKEAFQGTRADLLASYAPPPKWLKQDLSNEISDAVLLASLSGHKDAADELASWIKASNRAHRGRPRDEERQKRYKKAAELWQTPGKNGRKRSWGQITKLLCSGRVDPSHRCDKSCIDKIRLGASQYL